ncbi:MAG: hypothetical protein JW803_00680 [Endomicrobiales bacterium]|nr:hypothetical protein [Endomicrobiales bacterium]
MKKFIAFAAVCAVFAAPALAKDPFDEFNNVVSLGGTIAQEALDNLSKDLGMLMGGGAVHQGANLGVPGLDIGIHVPMKSVKDENTIVKAADVDNILLPILQAEVGLPGNIDVIGRYTGYAGASMVGGGLRYGILKPSVPGLPSVSAQVVYNALNVSSNGNKFTATTMSALATASIGFPVITPYAAVGFDQTAIKPDSTISDKEGAASGLRIEGGVNLKLIPLTYLQMGASSVCGETGYTVGLGVKF